MESRTIEKNGISVLEITGNITQEDVSNFHTAIYGLVEKGKINIIIDFSNVNFPLVPQFLQLILIESPGLPRMINILLQSGHRTFFCTMVFFLFNRRAYIKELYLCFIESEIVPF